MKIIRIWFEKERIYGETDDRRELWQSLLYYRRLMQASAKERENFEMNSFGIHWPELDEDISFESFEYPDPEPVGISWFFLSHPEINASAVARRLGMKQSLLAAYINGTKKPSAQREQIIVNELRQIGKELTEL